MSGGGSRAPVDGAGRSDRIDSIDRLLSATLAHAVGGVAGIGCDVVWIPDFAQQWERPGTVFAAAFRPGELRRAAAGRPGERVAHLAARWAGKEAVIKAWSSAYHGREPVLDRVDPADVEIVVDRSGCPGVRLHGPAAEHLRGEALRVSLSHDGDVALAVAVLTAPVGDEAARRASASASAPRR